MAQINFTHSIIKIDKDGARVMSNTLSPGEKLLNGVTYRQVKKYGDSEGTIPTETLNDILGIDTESPNVGGTMQADDTITHTVYGGFNKNSSQQ